MLMEWHTSAISVERVHFPKTDRAVDGKKTDPFLSLPGAGPVLVTAPRAVRYGEKKRPKPSAESTGSIAYLLHEACHCHVLALKKFYGGDPEQDHPCRFKEKLARTIESEGIRLVLNLGALPPSAPYDAEIITFVPRKQAMAEKIVETSWSPLPGRVRFGDAGHFGAASVAGAALMAGAGVVEVRLKKSLRVPRQNPGDFNRMMTALVSLIESIRLDI